MVTFTGVLQDFVVKSVISICRFICVCVFNLIKQSCQKISYSDQEKAAWFANVQLTKVIMICGCGTKKADEPFDT